MRSQGSKSLYISIIRIVGILLCLFVLTFSAFAEYLPASFVPAERAEAAASSTPTKVTGLKRSYSMTRYDKTITDTIKVSPAYGRKVTVSFYDPGTKKWKKYKSFKTANKKTASVKISYPYYWKQHYSSKFRVRIPEKTITKKAENQETQEGVLPDEDITTYEAYSKTVKVTNKTIPGVTSVLMNADTGEVLAEKDMHVRRKIASVTKVMTAILLTESGKLKEKTTMTKAAANTPWALGLRKGDKLTGTQLLNLMIVGSCNEAAAQAGIFAKGSTKKFVKAADRRAKELGALDTKYANAHGIDDGTSHSKGNYSTAYDQAKIASFVMTSKSMKPVRKAALKSRYFVRRRGRWIGRYNTNLLLGKDGNVGLKTGTERTAKNCFVGAYKYNGQRYITVVLGAPTSSAKWSSTVNLKNYMKYSVKQGYTGI